MYKGIKPEAPNMQFSMLTDLLLLERKQLPSQGSKGNYFSFP